MVVHVRDLKDQGNTPYPRPFLFCHKCQAEYSADTKPDTVITCCGEPCVLVVRHTSLEEVQP